MSFAFASYNDYGIVMSADRCLTGNSNGSIYNVSGSIRKLFLSKQGFGITYTGCSSVEGKPIQLKISSILEQLDSSKNLYDFFSEFVINMSENHSGNTIFIAAGYQDNVPKIYTATTTNTEIMSMSPQCYSGESTLAEKLICSIAVPYDSITIQDRIDFHRFITRTISRLQQFSDKVPTVSESCDVIAIGKNGLLFSSFSELH